VPLIDRGSYGSRLFPLSPPLVVLDATSSRAPGWAAARAPSPAGLGGWGYVVLVDRPSALDAVLVGPLPTADAAGAWWVGQQPAFPGAYAYTLPVLAPPDPSLGVGPAAVHVRPHYSTGQAGPAAGGPDDR
jgi:hypothetical protein